MHLIADLNDTIMEQIISLATSKPQGNLPILGRLFLSKCHIFSYFIVEHLKYGKKMEDTSPVAK